MIAVHPAAPLCGGRHTASDGRPEAERPIADPGPASTGAVGCLEAVASVLDHAVATLRSAAGDDHPRDRGERR